MVTSSQKYECYREFLSSYIESHGFSLSEFSDHVGGGISKTSLSLVLKRDLKHRFLRSHGLSDLCWAAVVDKLNLSMEEKQHLLILKLAEDILVKTDDPGLRSLAMSLKKVQTSSPDPQATRGETIGKAQALKAALDFLPNRFKRPIFTEVRSQIQRSKEANRYEAARNGLNRYEAEFTEVSRSLEA